MRREIPGTDIPVDTPTGMSVEDIEIFIEIIVSGNESSEEEE